MKRNLILSIALAAIIVPAGQAAGPVSSAAAVRFVQSDQPTQDQLTQFITDQVATKKVSKDDGDLCLAVVQRHFSDPTSMKSSENDLFNAMVAEYPHWVKYTEGKKAGIITRDPHNNPMADLLGGGDSGGSSTPTPHKKKASSAPTPAAKSKPKPLAARHKAAFLSGSHKSGGHTVGYVTLSVDGRETTLVEVNASSGSMTVGERARRIRDRFAKLNNADKNWWMKLSVGTYKNGEVIVQSPRAEKGIVITADKDYAASRGMDPKGLAKDLIVKIRNGFEPGG